MAHYQTYMQAIDWSNYGPSSNVVAFNGNIYYCYELKQSFTSPQTLSLYIYTRIQCIWKKWSILAATGRRYRQDNDSLLKSYLKATEPSQ